MSPSFSFCKLMLAVGSSLCGFAYAQVAVSMDEVVITGSATPSKNSSPAPAERLGGDALLVRPSSSLGETLSGLAGVGSSYFGGTASRPIIRGLDGDRVRIISNGAALSDASSLSFDHAVSDSPLASERVEIVRGPQSLVYSGFAAGGLVQTIDNRITKSALFDAGGGQLGKAQASMGTGSQERLGAALVETGTDKFALHVDGFARRAGEVAVPKTLNCTQGGVTRTTNRICNSQAESRGGAVGGSMFFDGGYLGLSVQGTAQNYGSPAEDEVGIQMRSSRTRFEGAAKNWTWHLVQSDYQHQELTAGAVGTTFKNKGLDGKLEWQQGSEQGLTKLGFGQTRNRFVADGVEAFVPKTFSQSQALYALQEMKLSQATVSMAWRGELSDVNSLGSDSAARFVAAGRHFAASNLALGAVLPLTANVSVTADAARGARAPKDYELYADGEHVATKSYEVGNSKLGVEQSKHSELGLRWQSGRADSARLAVFQTSYDNFIIASPTGASSTAGNPIYQYGAVPARLTGWELTANQRAVSWMDVQARMSSVQGRNLATAEPLPRMAPLRIGLDATSKTNWRGMPVTFKLGFDHSAAQNLVPTNQTSVASYTLWNAAMTLEQKMQTHRALWFARLDNITNSLAYPATSILTQTAPGRVPLPGRNAQLGVQVSF